MWVSSSASCTEEYQLYGAQAQALGQPYTLGGNPSSIANRVSYFCNFHGPSLAVDTMCSSSLTAIHLACQSLMHGGCELAIAGGVNVSVHPNKYLVLSQTQFASSRGRCESFGEGGDGYVPGEGVGAVLLKPLSKAIADGDHIYGVIRGSSINHGGKTNGYTVPNPNAQYELIMAALENAKVDPRTISYIEAHGTGTSLGDPIEIAGLTRAFNQLSGEKLIQTCAIGSVKSNIGHCESAAGIAGVTKVLLQMRHGELAPSLHSQRLNPNIDFGQTPFKVQQRLEAWNRPKVRIDGIEREYSRIAGISAFGAGGANAHVIIEEYVGEKTEERRAKVDESLPAIIVLSAKTEGQLKEQAEKLLEAIGRGVYGEGELMDLAYTLQVGREALEERMATTVTSWESLVVRLEQYCADPSHNGEWSRGSVKKDKDSTSFFKSDDDAQNLIATWLAKGKYHKLIDLWVKGLPVNWARLYPANSGLRRISLPTYPFAKERYWIEVGHRAPGVRPTGIGQLHPLLHQNNSNAFESKFESTFTGEEFFFNDHQIGGLKLLPGVGHLEMARVAVARALDTDSAMALSDVVWLRPIVLAEGARHVQIGVQARSETEADYEIYGADEDDKETVYSRGHARLIARVDRTSLDLTRLREICANQPLTHEQLYAAFASRGFKYGSGHQGITDLFVGFDADQRPQALATLRLPQSVADTADEFVLHPSVMDCALQASVGLEVALSVTGSQIDKPMAPFALEALSIYAKTPARAYAWARFSKGSNPGDAVQKLDISLCDEQGAVCVEFSGLSLRALSGELTGHSSKTVLLQPRWEEQPISASATDLIPDAHRELFVLGAFSAAQQEAVERRLSGRRMHFMASTDESLVVNYELMARRLFESAQQRLQQKLAQPYLLQVVIAVDSSAPATCYSGLSGLLKTASQENPNLITQCIQVPASIAGSELIDMINAEARDLSEQEIRWRHNRREVKRPTEMVSLDQAADPEQSWRDDGVYLITGGAGGLGLDRG